MTQFILITYLIKIPNLPLKCPCTRGVWNYPPNIKFQNTIYRLWLDYVCARFVPTYRQYFPNITLQSSVWKYRKICILMNTLTLKQYWWCHMEYSVMNQRVGNKNNYFSLLSSHITSLWSWFPIENNFLWSHKSIYWTIRCVQCDTYYLYQRNRHEKELLFIVYNLSNMSKIR